MLTKVGCVCNYHIPACSNSLNESMNNRSNFLKVSNVLLSAGIIQGTRACIYVYWSTGRTWIFFDVNISENSFKVWFGGYFMSSASHSDLHIHFKTLDYVIRILVWRYSGSRGLQQCPAIQVQLEPARCPVQHSQWCSVPWKWKGLNLSYLSHAATIWSNSYFEARGRQFPKWVAFFVQRTYYFKAVFTNSV